MNLQVKLEILIIEELIKKNLQVLKLQNIKNLMQNFIKSIL